MKHPIFVAYGVVYDEQEGRYVMALLDENLACRFAHEGRKVFYTLAAALREWLSIKDSELAH